MTKHKHAIYPYWVHACIAAAVTIVLMWALLFLVGGDWGALHRPVTGPIGLFASFFLLLVWIERRARANEDPE